MVMYREVCPEGVQNKCPGGVWCRGFMSWGDTLILVISRGVQLYYGIAHLVSEVRSFLSQLSMRTYTVIYGAKEWDWENTETPGKTEIYGVLRRN